MIIGKTSGDFVGSEAFSFMASTTDGTASGTGSLSNTPNIFGWMSQYFPDATNVIQNQVWAYGHKNDTQQWIETLTPDGVWANYGDITNP
jgi:hypothetical protein